MATPKKFFHGTDAELKPGEKITPASSRGKGDRYGYSEYDDAPKGRKRPDWAFSSQTEKSAWNYAHSAARDNVDGTSSTFNDRRRGPEVNRGRVYEVKPTTQPVRGPEFYSDGRDEHVAKGWEVVKQIDSQPGKHSALPGINWNHHATQYAAGDQNHQEMNPHKGETPFTHNAKLPPMAHRNQLDLFNDRTVAENVDGSRTPEAKYHANAALGVPVEFKSHQWGAGNW